MIKRMKQAGKLLLSGLFVIVMASPTWASGEEDAYRSARRARAEAESSEVDGVFVRLGGWVDDLFSSDEGEVSSKKIKRGSRLDAEEGAVGEARSEEKDGPTGVIKAKRLDPISTDSEKAQKTQTDQPYKIYPSPVILEDPPAYRDSYGETRAHVQALGAESRAASEAEGYPSPEIQIQPSPKAEEPYAPPEIEVLPSPRAEQPTIRHHTSREEEKSSPSDAFVGWKGTPRTIDTTKPPPLPDYVNRRLAGGASAADASLRQAGSTAGVPPISALPKQFFPVLPSGALPDARPQLLPVASNRELEADNGDVTRAIIVIHDIQRGSAEGIATLMTLSGASSGEALILAPQFPLGVDIARFAPYLPEQGRNVARWSVEQGWQNGGDSFLPSSKIGVSSFSAVDLLLLFLSDRRRFPVLEQVVVVGHGMGADFVQRYAAVGQAPEVLKKEGVTIRFLVANPSSYLYFTANRPSERGPTFAIPKETGCAEINDFPYGLNNLNAYTRRTGPHEIRMRYPERNVVYLVGGRIVTDNFLDRGCAAAAQGQDRATRGKNYARYLTQTFGDALGGRHVFATIPNAGYDPVAVLGSFCGMEVLFGSGKCGE